MSSDVRNADTLAMVRELAKRMELNDEDSMAFESEIMTRCGYEVESVETTFTKPHNSGARVSTDFLNSLGITE